MFIEMNPRIQVECSVTEEIVDVDLVFSQLWIAVRALLDELDLGQQDTRPHGVVLSPDHHRGSG